MSEPTWKRLADQLKADRAESPYHDRIKRTLPGGGVDGLAVEIMQEMASALGRAEEKVTRAIETLKAQGRKIEAHAGLPTTDPVEQRYRIDEYNRQHAAAENALWELRVHREALGFLRNDDLPALYPIPPKIRVL